MVSPGARVRDWWVVGASSGGLTGPGPGGLTGPIGPAYPELVRVPSGSRSLILGPECYDAGLKVIL